MYERLEPHRADDALLLLNLQNDFFPGGYTPVETAEETLPRCNLAMENAARRGRPIFLSREWHPRHHVSFRSAGGALPDHCVQGSTGAAFHPELCIPPSARILSTGRLRRFDDDSPFDRSDLDDELGARGIRRLVIGGLALEDAVLLSVHAALQRRFRVGVLADGTRPVDLMAGEETFSAMRAAGIELVG